MASGARKKEKGKDDMKKSLKDVEHAMNDLIINFGENVRGQNTYEDGVHANFSSLERMVANLPEGEKKKKLKKQLEEEQSVAAEAKEDLQRRLTRTVDDVQRKRFDEGDQSPLTGREALNLQNQWQMGFDYSPLNPFSHWMKVIYTGNYDGMMSILEGKSDMEVMMLLGMRESLMNVPALLHVVCGAKVGHSNQPAMLAEKRKMEGVMEVKYDHAMTTAMAEVVLKAGLDPNIQDRFGHTPLFRCMSTSVLTDLELFLKYGADPGIKDYQHGVSCLTLAHAFPAANRLFGKFTRKEAVKERGKAKEEMGGSLKKCVQCGKDNSARWETYFEKYLEADNKRLFQVQRLLRRPLLQR